jgi:hypothetical protein
LFCRSLAFFAHPGFLAPFFNSLLAHCNGVQQRWAGIIAG